MHFVCLSMHSSAVFEDLIGVCSLGLCEILAVDTEAAVAALLLVHRQQAAAPKKKLETCKYVL